MERKIKILMVLGCSGMGGIEMFILNLLKYMDFCRFQIDIAINCEVKESGVADEWRALGCQVFLLPKFRVYNYLYVIWQWRKFFRKHQYDIVHGHSTDSAYVYLGIAKKAGCVTIAHSHSAGHLGNRIEKKVKSFYAHKVGLVADYWFACSDEAAREVYGKQDSGHKKYYCIPNGINVRKYFYNGEKNKEIRRKLNVRDEELVCGHVGSFSVPKNHFFLLDIFSEILKHRPNARLVCCGAGRLTEQVKEKAVMMGILDQIVFAGVVKNVNDYLMAMDVMVFPSLFEGFPIAVIEAEAAGLPVVMSDVITKEVDQTDLVHRHALSDSAAVWAKTICSIKHRQRTEYNKVIADSKYNMQTCAQLITSLYEEMVE